MLPISTKSTESLYSNASSKYSPSAVYKRKQKQQNLTASSAGHHSNNTTNRGGGGGNAGGASNNNNSRPTFISGATEVRQRVLSARRLRMKTIQNQLTDAQIQIAELTHENRILRTLHKRQDNALAKYESTNAELPQLLHSHSEEVRVWQTKYRVLSNQNKELVLKLKQKDNIILHLNDQNKHLTQLNNDKNLEERERLTERVRDLEQKIVDKDNDLKLLSRKIQLEAKGYKTQLNAEHSRYKDILARLEKTRSELTGISKIDNLEIMNEKLPKLSFAAKPTVFKSKSSTKDSKKVTGLVSAVSDDSFIDSSIVSDNKLSPNLEKCKSSTITSAAASITGNTKLDNHKSKFNLRKNQKVTHNDIGEAIKKGMKSLKKSIDDSECDDNHTFTDLDSSKNDINNYEYTTQSHYKVDVSGGNDDDDDDDEDDEDDDENDDVILSAEMPEKTQNDFQTIRKQITNDYQEREKFLDKFCRESSTDALKNEIKRPIDVKKKVSLLAALKAIDENKTKDI